MDDLTLAVTQQASKYLSIMTGCNTLRAKHALQVQYKAFQTTVIVRLAGKAQSSDTSQAQTKYYIEES